MNGKTMEGKMMKRKSLKAEDLNPVTLYIFHVSCFTPDVSCLTN